MDVLDWRTYFCAVYDYNSITQISGSVCGRRWTDDISGQNPLPGMSQALLLSPLFSSSPDYHPPLHFSSPSSTSHVPAVAQPTSSLCTHPSQLLQSRGRVSTPNVNCSFYSPDVAWPTASSSSLIFALDSICRLVFHIFYYNLCFSFLVPSISTPLFIATYLWMVLHRNPVFTPLQRNQLYLTCRFTLFYIACWSLSFHEFLLSNAVAVIASFRVLVRQEAYYLCYFLLPNPPTSIWSNQHIIKKDVNY